MIIEIGEMRNQLALDLQRDLERVINKNKKDSSYFLLVYANMVDNDICTKIMKLHTRPPKMLGTMLYRVDNDKGQLRRLWCLPLDLPRSPEYISIEEGLEEVMKSAEGVAIAY